MKSEHLLKYYWQKTILQFHRYFCCRSGVDPLETHFFLELIALYRSLLLKENYKTVKIYIKKIFKQK